MTTSANDGSGVSAAQDASHADTSSPDLRWVALAVTLLVAMFVSPLPQYAIGILAPILTVEIGFGEVILGLSVGAMYVSAALIARFFGRGFDVIGGRLALVVLCATAVASLLTLAAVSTTFMLLVGCVLAGITMGTNNPITNRLILLHVRPGRRGMVIGVKQTGVKVAQIASGAIIPWLALTVGWRVGLVGIAAVTSGLLLAGLVFVPGEPTRQRTLRHDSMSVAAARRGFRWLQAYSVVMAIGMSTVTTYLPLYVVNRLGLSLTQAGLVVTVFAACATLTRLIWAIIAERRGDAAGVMFLQALGGIVALTLIGLAEVVGPVVLWPAAVLGGATVGAWNAVAQLAVITNVDPIHSAAVTGAVQSAFLVGLATGAPMMGAIVQFTSSFQLAWAATAALACIGAAIAFHNRRPRATARVAG